MEDIQTFVEAEESTGSFYDTTVRPVLAEFVGVAVFVFVGSLSVQTNTLTSIAIGHGFTIALLIMAFGKISGGHFNPSVTLGAALSKGLSAHLAILYFIAQLLGGLLGAAFVRAVLPHTSYEKILGGAHVLNDIEPGWAIVTEAILTFILVLTVLMTAVDDNNKTKLAPLAIGFAVVVDILAAGGTTGASMNPARSFGPAVAVSVYSDKVWTYHYVYWVGPLIGTLLAATIYRVLFASPSRRPGRI